MANFNEIGSSIMTGYIKAFRVFPICGDVSEFNTEAECWEYALAAWIKFKS